MNDFKIRTAIKEQEFRAHYLNPDTRIVDELSICHGMAIADIAVINGSLQGYEIKSDQDTLNRLPNQIESYNKVFDFINIVVSKKFSTKIEHHIPEWWGILKVEEIDEHIFINEYRKPTLNSSICPYSLLQLLWKEELILMIEEFGFPKSLKHKPKRNIWAYISENLESNIIKDKVRFILKTRANWREDQPLK